MGASRPRRFEGSFFFLGLGFRGLGVKGLGFKALGFWVSGISGLALGFGASWIIQGFRRGLGCGALECWFLGLKAFGDLRGLESQALRFRGFWGFEALGF